MWILYLFGSLFLFAFICDVEHRVRELDGKEQWLQSKIFEIKKRMERLEKTVGEDGSTPIVDNQK